jgi:glycine cleavage system H protein
VDNIKFHPEHAWITIDGNLGIIGVSDFAQQQLGEIIYVDLPKIDFEIKVGDPLCALESNKVATDVISPVSGVIKEVNGALDEEPSLINSDPYGEGWLVKIILKDSAELQELMDQAAYDQLIAAK